ncbi:MAG: UDP-N-acetylglucosamine 1-carboxyvinyltransferase [bacterium]
MQCLDIQGGVPLRGTLKAAGNKNAVLPMIAAALLTDEPVVLENVPDIGDVGTMAELVAGLGAVVRREPEKNRLSIQAVEVNPDRLSFALCRRIRASILLAAPVLQRAGRCAIATPGGDIIGRRRLESHLVGLRQLGAQVAGEDPITFAAERGLHGGEVFLPEASVTATEQLLIAAALARGRTVLRNAACEPHVCEVANMLASMGASIEGIGSNVLTVEGCERLGGGTFRVGSDHTEVGSFLALAAATGGEITITDIDPDHYRHSLVLPVFERLGVSIELEGATISVRAEQSRRIAADPSGGLPVIDDGPWPKFPSDLMSVMLLLATQVEGTALFFEKMYESRMYFMDRLISMGARAVICDPHRVVVCGPARLHGIDIASPDIRAGIALIGGALCAEGRSTISNVHLVDRGYQAIDQRLNALGAKVVRRG